MAGISFAVCALLTWAYHVRPDWAAALTLFPAWAWLFLSSLLCFSLRRRPGQIGLGCWLVFALLHVEEPRSLLRSLLPAPAPHSLRIATVNATGSFLAIADALKEAPDIVLVQESPAPAQWAGFLETHPDYQLLTGLDASILTKGSIELHHHGRFYTIARVHLHGQTFGVGSLRLATSDPRIDLWNPQCWRDQTGIRQKQLSQIWEVRSQLPASLPIILGGDFNVPQRDRVFTRLTERLNDSFSGAARGWCNTITTDFPMLRIDQIWTSRELQSVNTYTKKSAHTDHRIYVADFKFSAP